MRWSRCLLLAVLALVLGGCVTPPPGPPPLPPDVPTTPAERSTDFWIAGPQSVALAQFTVTSAGKVTITAEWSGASTTLQMELQGRRRPALPDPTAPHAVVSGSSPLQLSYQVQPEDLARGVAWRVVLRDPANAHDASGRLVIGTPFNADRESAFRAGRLGLRGGDLLPSAWLRHAFMNGLAAAPAGARHAVVTLNKACNCKDNLALRREGVTLLKHLPNRHALARIERGFTPGPASFVAGITPLEPEDKIDPHILVGNYARYTVAPDPGLPTNLVWAGNGQLNVTVSFFGGVARDRIGAIFQAESLVGRALSDSQWQVTVPEARLRRLAAYDEVEAIDTAPAPPLPDNDRSRLVIAANALQGGTVNPAGNAITYTGATGLGVTVGVQDTGIAAHPDLTVVATLATGTNAAGSHGTHVAGTLAGSGARSNGTNAAGAANNGAAFQWRGTAPRATLISSNDLDDTATLLTAIQTNSLDLINRSQSYGFDGNYDAENSRIDSLIAGSATQGGVRVPPRLLVTSAGNHGQAPNNQRPIITGPIGTTSTNAGGSGHFSITKQNKNALMVGNQSSLAGAAPVGLSPGSSLGPAHDGRIRPDVLALGTNVVSTGTVGDGSCVAVGTNLSNGYTPCSGTSMASPAVAGGVAQLLELWQTTYNAPIGATLDANPPLPSLLRALVIQTATDVVQADVRGAVSADLDLDSNAANGNDGLGRVNATAGPDYATGWGTANIGAAAAVLQDVRTTAGRPQSNRMVQGSIFQGGVREFDFVVNQAGPLRVTLAWDDAEAATLNPATSPMLVNDLDLELVGPDGRVYYPWRLGHTVTDTAGNALADAAQTPGTAIQVQPAVTPVANPSHQWRLDCIGGGPAPCPAGTQITPVAPVVRDTIPQNVFAAGGGWVAATGKDHLNNVEQVLVNVADPATQFGHWKARVIGFNVREDTQSFALVGFPYPALAELVPSSTARVGLPPFGTPISFTWQVTNTGPVGTGVGFTHQVLLSRDFALGNDVPLTDTSAPAFGPLGPGATAQRTSTVTLTAADAQALLGNPAATVDDLIAADVFLLVRVDSGDAVLEHQEQNLLAVQLARLVDVVAVFDRSGSMAATVPVSAGSQTKLQMLQDSANLFVDLLRLDAGDRLGQVSFADAASTDFDNGAGVVKPYGAAETAAVKGAVAGLAANGATNIRAALERALDLIPASTDRRKVVLFFSDGMRTAGGNPTEPAFLQRFTDKDVRVFSVGFGTEGGDGLSGIDVGMLQTLANTTAGGFFFVTQSGLELDKFFVNALANAVSAQVIVDPVETLAPGRRSDVKIDVAGTDRVVTFVLTWDNPALDPVFELVTPQGLVLNAANSASFADAIRRIDAAAHTLVQVRLPLRVGTATVHAGAWTMRVRNPHGVAIRFAATAITESPVIEATTVEPPSGGVFDLGEPVRLRTRLRHGTRPIADAQVSVRAVMPVTSLGNVLAAAGLTQAEVDATPAVIGGEPVDPLRRMTMALTQRLGRDPVGTVATTVEGRADPGAPGSYTTVFPLTRVPGAYQFTTRTEALGDECDLATRESVNSAWVPPTVDPRRTPIRISTTGGRVTVSVLPQDGAGHYVGPGLAHRVQIQASGLSPVSALVDRLDGRYEQRFVPVAGAREATVRITALNVPLPVQRAALDLPVVGGLTTTAGPPGTTTRVTLTGDAGGAPVLGMAFVRDGVVVPARSTRRDGAPSAIDVQVPAGLAPGLYDVVPLGATGPGPATEGAGFRVAGDGPSAPPPLVAIGRALAQLTTRGDAGGEWRVALLKAVREATPDGRLTAELKHRALREVVELLSRDGSAVKVDAVPALSALAALAGPSPR